MTPRCRPGELALVIRHPLAPEAIGSIVRCVTYRGPACISGAPFPQVWEIDLPDGGEPDQSGTPYGADDSWLWPLRDTDGVDETLRIAGLPAEREVTA